MKFYNGNGRSSEDVLVVFRGRILFDFDFEDEVFVLPIRWDELDAFIKAGTDDEFWCNESDFKRASFCVKKKDMLNLRLRCGD